MLWQWNQNRFEKDYDEKIPGEGFHHICLPVY